MMLKSTGIVSNSASMMPASAADSHVVAGPSLPVKAEPIIPLAEEAMEDDSSPIAGDPMLSASLTSPQTFSIEEALNPY